MDWSKELYDSMVWLGRTFIISMVFMVIIGFILVKTTRWASQFWRIGGSYFNPIKKPQTILMFCFILLLSLFGVRISVLLSNWYNAMYSALQAKDEQVFWLQMLVFGALATIHVLRVLFAFFLQQRFTIKWRESLNNQLLSRWIGDKNYYRFLFLDHPVDNPDQRIQQDVASFVEGSLSLTLGLISNLVSAVAFTIILWNLSGDISLGNLPYIGVVVVPHAMVFLIFIYVLLATVFAFKIGRPLIWLNFLNERLNANYRYGLIRVREYGESIAFYAGEKRESSRLFAAFYAVINNVWAIVFRSLKFQGFNLVISQIAVVYPLIIQAKRFFSGQLTLGDLMQTVQALNSLHDSLSFFRNIYDSFASYKATLNRLTGFVDSCERAENLPEPNVKRNGDKVQLDKVSIRTPNGNVLVKDLSFVVEPRQAVLIQGPSGSGKTTILRTIAGLWPYSDGQVCCPLEHSLFLSQKPYLPQGNLMEILYYPNEVPENAVDKVKEVLQQVQLSNLIDRLDQELPWMQTLSLGEQQRLAFGRLLLIQPKVAFLDEATSAMDEGLEYSMYRLILEKLPNMRLVSVGHRNTLKEHHTHVLYLKAGGAWQWNQA